MPAPPDPAPLLDDFTWRFDRLDQFVLNRRLIRREWGDGTVTACLLVGIAPEVGPQDAFGLSDLGADRHPVDRCPAHVLPPWFAALTPAVNDSGSEGAWSPMVRRYARVVREGARSLDSPGWRRVHARFLCAVLTECPNHPGADRVSALWSRVTRGDEPEEEEWRATADRALGAPQCAARAGRAHASPREALHAAYLVMRPTLEEAIWDRLTGALLDAVEAVVAEIADPRASP